MAAGGLTVAPLWRRLAAGAIDAAVLGVPTVALWIGGVWLYAKYGLVEPWTKRSQKGLNAAQAEIKEVRRIHEGDEEAQRRAMTDVFRRHDVSPLRSCLPPLVPVALQYLLAVWSPLNQTLPERIAGIVVVED
jgi:RDD family